MSESMTCGRRLGVPATSPGRDTWADHGDGYRACSYCGSMHPDEMFAKVEAGALVTPTDKSYKIYVQVPKGSGKFYFQHLDAAGQQRFLDLYNTRQMRLAFPGHFYRLPYFVTREGQES